MSSRFKCIKSWAFATDICSYYHNSVFIKSCLLIRSLGALFIRLITRHNIQISASFLLLNKDSDWQSIIRKKWNSLWISPLMVAWIAHNALQLQDALHIYKSAWLIFSWQQHISPSCLHYCSLHLHTRSSFMIDPFELCNLTVLWRCLFVQIRIWNNTT